MSDYSPKEDDLRLEIQARLNAEKESRLFAKLMAENHKDVAICDIGCAHGQLAVKRFKNYNFVGWDPSSDMIEKARLHFPTKRWEIVSADAAREMSGVQFDIVRSSRVIQHVDDPESFLVDCFASCRGGGVLVVVFPDDRYNIAEPKDPDIP